MPDISFFPVEAEAEGTDQPVMFAATTEQELHLLAAWVVALADWRGRVEACPFVQFTNGDIRSIVGKSLGGGKTPE